MESKQPVLVYLMIYWCMEHLKVQLKCLIKKMNRNTQFISINIKNMLAMQLQLSIFIQIDQIMLF